MWTIASPGLRPAAAGTRARVERAHDPLLSRPGAAPLQLHAGVGEGLDDEIAHRARLAGADHEVVGALLLQHLPLADDVVGREAPVALGVEVAQVQRALAAGEDRGERAGDLARDEGLAAAGRLVVEEDAVAAEEAVALAVVHRDPVGVDLGGGVRAARVEARQLVLRRRRGAEHLGGGGLVEARLDPGEADRLEQARGAQAGDVPGVLRLVEADRDVALRGEVVDLVGAQLPDQVGQAAGVGQVAEVHVQAPLVLVLVEVEVVDAVGVEGAGAALDAVDLVALGEQELGEVRAVLAGDAGDQRAFHRCSASIVFHDQIERLAPVGQREAEGLGELRAVEQRVRRAPGPARDSPGSSSARPGPRGSAAAAGARCRIARANSNQVVSPAALRW